MECIEKIKSANVIQDPFPHFVIEDFLPNFDKFKYPEKEFFNAKTSSKSRKIIEHTSILFDRILKNNNEINSLFKLVNSKIFKDALLNKFLKNIKELNCPMPSDIESQMDITRATKGYRRSIHLDRTKHIISSMIYFNHNSDFGGKGGELCLHYEDKNKDEYDVFPEYLPIHKTIAPKKNLYIAWLACPYAYHSVVPLTEAIGYRKFIYIALNDKSDSVWSNKNIKVMSEERRTRFVNE